MDEEEKTRVTDLVATGAGTVVGVAAAVHPALAWAAPMIQGAFTVAGNRFNASRKARLEKALAEKIIDLPKDYVEKRVQEPGFQDLLEEATFQITRPVSEERIEQIASVLEHGLADDDAEAVRYKKLLSILGELNDAEVIVLGSFNKGNGQEHNDYYEKHKNVIQTPWVLTDSSQAEFDRATVSTSYYEQLERLRLLKNSRANRSIDPPPTGGANIAEYMRGELIITSLGQLLLRTIETEINGKKDSHPRSPAATGTSSL